MNSDQFVDDVKSFISDQDLLNKEQSEICKYINMIAGESEEIRSLIETIVNIEKCKKAIKDKALTIPKI